MDYHPWNSAFHLTAGMMDNELSLSFTINPDYSGYTFNEQTYSSSQIKSASGEIVFGSSATPYIGFGWLGGTNPESKLQIGLNLGLLYNDSPLVRFRAKCNRRTLSYTTCKEINDNVRQDRQQLEDDLQQIPFYPVAKVNLSYQF